MPEWGWSWGGYQGNGAGGAAFEGFAGLRGFGWLGVLWVRGDVGRINWQVGCYWVGVGFQETELGLDEGKVGGEESVGEDRGDGRLGYVGGEGRWLEATEVAPYCFSP